MIILGIRNEIEIEGYFWMEYWKKSIYENKHNCNNMLIGKIENRKALDNVKSQTNNVLGLLRGY